MEVSDKKLGEFVECIECGEMVEVKPLPPPKPTRRKRSPDEFIGTDYLTIYEYLLYGMFFVLCPGLNVIVCTVLNAMWKDDQKTKAYQIMLMGWLIFVFQVVPVCCFCCFSAFAAPRA
jgi:hypothetical protein